MVAALTINPNTVLKAYKELETKGLAAGRPGQGTFVMATLSQVTLPELGVLRRSVLTWLADASETGLDEDGIVALFTSALRDFFKGRGGTATRVSAGKAGKAGNAGNAGNAGKAGNSGNAGKARNAGNAARSETEGVA